MTVTITRDAEAGCCYKFSYVYKHTDKLKGGCEQYLHGEFHANPTELIMNLIRKFGLSSSDVVHAAKKMEKLFP